jgi:hypothetical protein
MRESRGSCLVVRAQFEQEQLPPHAQPPEVDVLDASPVPTTAKVENMTFVLVLSHSGQTWRSSRLAYPPKTSNVWRQLRQENS